MAAPVVESTAQNASSADVSSLVVTAPTGISVGDYLIAWAGWRDNGSSRELSTPSGWTSLYNSGDEFDGAALFVKVAVSGDTTAADYTFTFSSNTNYVAAGILRISGAASGNENAGNEVDVEGSPTGASPSYTTALTPQSDESLLVTCYYGADTSIGSVPTVSSYAATPSQTFTERIDTGAQSGGGSGSGIAIGVATAELSGTAGITNRSATFSTDMTQGRIGVALIVNAPQNETGTSALLEVSPTFFAGTSSFGTTGSSALLEVSPAFFASNGTGTQPTVWSNETRNNTTWTNEDKSS